MNISWTDVLAEMGNTASDALRWTLTSHTPASGMALAALVVALVWTGIAFGQWLFAPEGDGMWTETDEDYGRRVLSPTYRGWRG